MMLGPGDPTPSPSPSRRAVTSSFARRSRTSPSRKQRRRAGSARPSSAATRPACSTSAPPRRGPRCRRRSRSGGLRPRLRGGAVRAPLEERRKPGRSRGARWRARAARCRCPADAGRRVPRGRRRGDRRRDRHRPGVARGQGLSLERRRAGAPPPRREPARPRAPVRAFLATYTTGLAASGKPQRRPPGDAVREASSAADRRRLLALLQPVHRTSERSALVKALADSGRLLPPQAWTPAEARTASSAKCRPSRRPGSSSACPTGGAAAGPRGRA